MTIPAMKRAAIAAAVASCLLAGCAATQASAPASRHGSPGARKALAAVEHLENRADNLRGKLHALQAHDQELRRGLDKLAGRLARAVADLHSRIDAVATTAAGANDKASAAMAKAGAVATDAAQAIAKTEAVSREIEVLTQRFDYHLRHSGGR